MRGGAVEQSRVRRPGVVHPEPGGLLEGDQGEVGHQPGAVRVRSALDEPVGYDRSDGRQLARFSLLQFARGADDGVASAQMLVLARVDRVVYGAADPKAGAAGSLWDVVRDRRLNHRPEVVGGVLAADCSAVLRAFFEDRRGLR